MSAKPRNIATEDYNLLQKELGKFQGSSAMTPDQLSNAKSEDLGNSQEMVRTVVSDRVSSRAFHSSRYGTHVHAIVCVGMNCLIEKLAGNGLGHQGISSRRGLFQADFLGRRPQQAASDQVWPARAAYFSRNFMAL
jgi:hypothetical protein